MDAAILCYNREVLNCTGNGTQAVQATVHTASDNGRSVRVGETGWTVKRGLPIANGEPRTSLQRYTPRVIAADTHS
eukprot:23691-Hanusia_phi.AAC.2